MNDPISRENPADIPAEDHAPEATPESSVTADTPAPQPASGATVEPEPSPEKTAMIDTPVDASEVGDLAPTPPGEVGEMGAATEALGAADPADREATPAAVRAPAMVPDIRLDILTAEPLTPEVAVRLKRRVMRSVRHARHFQTILDRTYGPESREEAQFLRGVGLWLLSRHHGAAEALGDHRGEQLADYLLAEMLLRDDRVDEAVEAFRALVAKHSKEPLFWSGLAEALDKTTDDEAFQAAVQSFLALDPEGPGAHYLKGMEAERAGDYDEAEQRYATAVVMDRDCDGARFRLAQHHYLRGDEEKAVELYEELTMRPPSSASALVNLGIIHEDREEYDEAARCYRAVLDYYPDHTRARMYLRDVLASKEMYYDEEKERKEDKKAQILRIPVTDFELSVRSRNCLAKMNIRTLGDLIKKTEAELLAFKNFGETSLAEIKEILRQKNLRLGMVTEEEQPVPEDIAPPPDPDSVMNKPLSDLDLSVRSRKACEFLRVITVGDLTRVTESDLLACKNFGQTSLNEIKKKLADMGLALRS